MVSNAKSFMNETRVALSSYSRFSKADFKKGKYRKSKLINLSHLISPENFELAMEYLDDIEKVFGTDIHFLEPDQFLDVSYIANPENPSLNKRDNRVVIKLPDPMSVTFLSRLIHRAILGSYINLMIRNLSLKDICEFMELDEITVSRNYYYYLKQMSHIFYDYLISEILPSNTSEAIQKIFEGVLYFPTTLTALSRTCNQAYGVVRRLDIEGEVFSGGRKETGGYQGCACDGFVNDLDGKEYKISINSDPYKEFGSANEINNLDNFILDKVKSLITQNKNVEYQGIPVFKGNNPTDIVYEGSDLIGRKANRWNYFIVRKSQNKHDSRGCYIVFAGCLPNVLEVLDL